MKANSLAPVVHHEIVSSLIETGAAANAEELARRLSVPLIDVEAAYRWLHDNHGLVLHPDCCEPWIVHPFALSPSHVWVESGDRGWWAPCTWCALGIVHLVGGTACIHARIGGEREPIAINMNDGRTTADDLLVHFALPVRAAWDNVHHYCAMVLPFRSRTDITRWSRRHRLPLGEAVPVAQASDLARHWYGQHHARNWTKWTPLQAAAIFQRVGLTGPFWAIEDRPGAF
jgi:hypothetical protein